MKVILQCSQPSRSRFSLLEAAVAAVAAVETAVTHGVMLDLTAELQHQGGLVTFRQAHGHPPTPKQRNATHGCPRQLSTTNQRQLPSTAKHCQAAPWCARDSIDMQVRASSHGLYLYLSRRRLPCPALPAAAR